MVLRLLWWLTQQKARFHCLATLPIVLTPSLPGNTTRCINPFTASASKISRLKDAKTRLQRVRFPVLQHIYF